MASRQRSRSPLPPYSRRPTANEQVLRIAPDFPLAIEAIQVVQEWFPGTSAGDAWEFIQQLAHLVRADVRNRRGDGTRTSHGDATERTAEDDPPCNDPSRHPYFFLSKSSYRLP